MGLDKEDFSILIEINEQLKQIKQIIDKILGGD